MHRTLLRPYLAHLAGLILLGPLCTGSVAAQEPSSAAAAYPPVPILQSQLRTLHSSVVGEDYLLKIRLPASYDASERRYPVLYLLDGDHAFAMATDLVQYLEYSGEVPPLIIVSPAYGSKDTPDYGGTNMRNRDLLAFPGYQPEEPGAQNFFRFLRDELIPYVDANFRTDVTDRTLWGYSYGCDFGLYALFQEPNPFHRYILIDGYLPELAEVESAYAAAHTDLPATVFLAYGQPDGDLHRFVDSLKTRGYPGLRLEYVPLAGFTHFAVGGEGFARGLKYVFTGRAISAEMWRIIQTEGIDAAVARYWDLKRAAAEGYNWSESQLNDLGYTLLSLERASDAIAVFELNVEAYPESPNTHDSLGDGLRAAGRLEKARDAYSRAVALAESQRVPGLPGFRANLESVMQQLGEQR